MMNRSFAPVDFMNPDDRVFLFDLWETLQHDVYNDHDNDPILMLNELQQGANVARIGYVDGERAGVIWVEVDRYGTGTVHAGLMPEYQNGFHALWFLKTFIQLCFETLGLRKLTAEIPTFNRKAEAVLRRSGFRKEGIRKQAIMIEGKPQDYVILSLLREAWDKRSHGKEEQRTRATSDAGASATSE